MVEKLDSRFTQVTTQCLNCMRNTKFESKFYC